MKTELGLLFSLLQTHFQNNRFAFRVTLRERNDTPRTSIVSVPTIFNHFLFNNSKLTLQIYILVFLVLFLN